MYEVETKVLDVDAAALAEQLQELGARQVQDTKLVVDWFRQPEWREGDDEWYLRIRSYSDGKAEVTWKGRSEKLGVSRKHKEINFLVPDPEIIADLFEAIGLERYAHQEKFRKSWMLEDWRFDLDQYPGMPAYLEIEGASEEHIQQALLMLDVIGHKTSSEGERVLIQTEYGLDWYNMRF